MSKEAEEMDRKTDDGPRYLRRLVLRFRHAADCRYDVAGRRREEGKYDAGSEASADAYMRASRELERALDGEEIPEVGEPWPEDEPDCRTLPN